MATVLIRNLKSISQLDFDIPVGGVHVLTGINGCGKTTLLACLERLTNSNAFPRYLRTSSSDQFDNFRNSEISYSHGGNTVSYRYKNTRWAPNPRKNASVLRNLGYSEALFLPSTGERFYVQNDELDTRSIVASPSYFKDGMNEIFQTTKYNDLRRVKLSGRGRGNGRWNYGFVMPLPAHSGQTRYYTEKNFSLGEILILNALFQLQNAKVDSLVLIDEVELALHPRVQVKFLQYLQRLSAQKNLTVIISTHSSSLIKSATKLIYLERETSGVVKIEYDCYPAIALQNVAVSDEVQPDIVFYVEDNYAKYVLEELLRYYFHHLAQGRRPIIKVLPVGGWENTIRLMRDSIGYLHPLNTRVFSFLDLDVEAYIQAVQGNPHRTNGEQGQLDLFNNNNQNIKFLPITPELGIVNLLNDNPQNHTQPLQDFFNGVFDISQIITAEANRGIAYSTNQRKAAKVRLGFYIEQLQQLTNRDANQIKIMLSQYYANDFCPQNHGNLFALFNPVFI